MMSELSQVLSQLKEVDLEDLKVKYTKAVRMLFALIESVSECSTRPVELMIYAMYNSLIKDD